MLLEGVGIKRRLIPALIAVAFTLIVAAIGNDVLAAYGGVVVFVVIYAAVLDHAERHGNAPWINQS